MSEYVKKTRLQVADTIHSLQVEKMDIEDIKDDVAQKQKEIKKRQDDLMKKNSKMDSYSNY